MWKWLCTWGIMLRTKKEVWLRAWVVFLEFLRDYIVNFLVCFLTNIHFCPKVQTFWGILRMYCQMNDMPASYSKIQEKMHRIFELYREIWESWCLKMIKKSRKMFLCMRLFKNFPILFFSCQCHVHYMSALPDRIHKVETQDIAVSTFTIVLTVIFMFVSLYFKAYIITRNHLACSLVFS